MRTTLTRAQAHAMIHLNGKWKSAKEIGVSLLSLESLKAKGIVERVTIDKPSKPEANLYRLCHD